MDIALLIKAAVMGIVEGFTEFLPISSTGHLILVGDLLNFNDERGKVFAAARKHQQRFCIGVHGFIEHQLAQGFAERRTARLTRSDNIDATLAQHRRDKLDM